MYVQVNNYEDLGPESTVSHISWIIEINGHHKPAIQLPVLSD